MLGRRRRRRGERGASAVEFALVVPILVALLLGILDYGIIFTDSVSTRNGVREAARKGVVSNFGTGSCSGTTMASLACQTKKEIDSLSGTLPKVKVYAPGGWIKGKPLIVCSVILDPGVINFVPTPADVKSRVELSIETATAPTTGGLTYADPGYTWPSGASSWC